MMVFSLRPTGSAVSVSGNLQAMMTGSGAGRAAERLKVRWEYEGADKGATEEFE